MNSIENISSTPNTIQNYNNYLKDYVNISGFQWNSTCLEVTFSNLGNNFDKYVQKVGDYNTVTSTNVKYIAPVSYQEKDYSKKCPEGWTETNNIWNTTCKNLNYTGPCAAGRTTRTPVTPTCPRKIFGDPSKYQEQYTYWSWSWWPWWRNGTRYYPNNNHYTGWYGPTDASQENFNNTNIGRKNPGEGNFCSAGWAAQNSMGGAQLDCQISGGQWVNYYDDPGFWKNKYTCYKPTEYNNVTEASSSFDGYTNEQKMKWENNCGAYWPMKTVNIPGRYTCTYGDKIENDIASGRVFQIGTANTPVEAAKLALKSNRLRDNYFFMIDNGVYIVGLNNNVGIFTTKGFYEPNCTEQNNRKGTLYFISQDFFGMLENCKIINNKINNVNISRNILQNAITSIKENFIGKAGQSKNSPIIENFEMQEITKNQNEITANLVSNYNKKAELYNYQIDLIGNNEKLVEDHNKKLNKQFNDLTAIQEQIVLKDRVIELNEELIKKQIRNKKILIGFFVLLPFLGIPLLLVILKIFNPFAGLGLAALIVVGYIIYILVISNQRDIKNFRKEDNRVISKYERALTKYWNKEKEKLSKSLSEFVNGKCDDGKTDQKTKENTKNIEFPKGDYLMKSNGPFYYYDGSAPPQQIYPGAVGSIEFSIEGQNQIFPNNFDLSKIKNPITKFFFETWVSILNKNGITLDDFRFNEVLDVIDFPDSDQTPMPFWDNIKLPIVTNINQQFNYLFQSYSNEKKNLSKTASVLIIDLWNFIFGDKIPNDIYESWVNKLANVIKQTNPDIEKYYSDYLQYIIGLTKFSDKYGNDDAGLEKFVEIKMIDFIKTFNQDINVSQPFAKKYDP
jgi:hypothetical protein